MRDADTANYLYSLAAEQSSTLLLDDSATEEEEYYPSIVSEYNYYMGPLEDEGQTVNSNFCLSCTDSNEEWSLRCLPLCGNSMWSVARSLLSWSSIPIKLICRYISIEWIVPYRGKDAGAMYSG